MLRFGVALVYFVLNYPAGPIWITLIVASIAERLFLSPATAKTYVSRAMGKLRVRDRAQLVVIAYESGLVRPAGSTEACSARASACS